MVVITVMECDNKIDQFRCIKIQVQSIDLSMRPRGKKYRVCGAYSPESYVDVYCFRLNLIY